MEPYETGLPPPEDHGTYLDPMGLVESWVDQLDTIRHMDLSTDLDPVVCYDLVAIAGKLNRTKPELVEESGGVELLAWAEEFIAERSECLPKAVRFPNPQGWLQEAQEWEAGFHEDDTTGDELVESGESLLIDLDDAEVVLAFAEQHGQEPDDILQGNIEQCRSWLSKHADLFFDARLLAGALAQTVRDDIEDVSPRLAATCQKFNAILRASREVETELNWIPQLSEAAYQVMREILEAEREKPPSAEDLAHRYYIYRWINPPGMAAANFENAPRIRWHSPDRNLRAGATLVPGQRELVIRFLDPHEKPAEQLQGTRIILDGVAAVIGPDARARVDREALSEAASRELKLVVGDSVWSVHWEQTDGE